MGGGGVCEKVTNMGMDLKPINPSADAPRYPDDYPNEPVRGQAKWGRYSWRGWDKITTYLESWGVNIDEFAGSNDGEVICDATCKAVADAIDANASQLTNDGNEHLIEDAVLWRTCGGYEQH